MTAALLLLLLCTSKLDAILVARSDMSSVPFVASTSASGRTESDSLGQTGVHGVFARAKRIWDTVMVLLVEWLEAWTAPKDETTIAWTLGIGWACCGGGLAGGCLVFAKAT